MSAAVSAAKAPTLREHPILLGVAIFIASESVFFLAVVLAYVAYRDSGLATARANLDVVRTAVFSTALFASSGTMAIAARARSGVWLAATISHEALFALGVVLTVFSLVAVGLYTLRTESN